MRVFDLARRVSRRSLVSGSLVAAGAVIAACAAPAPTATPVPAKPAPAPAAPPKPAEAPKPAAPAAPAPTATTAPAKPAEAPKPAAAPATKAPIELRIHDWEQDPDRKFYGPLFAKFEQENPGVKLKLEWFPRNDMHAKFLALSSTGQLGDTVRINVAVVTKELVNKNVLGSLTPFIQKDTKWFENDHKQFWPGNIQNYEFKGQQWGYPVVGHPGCIHHFANLDMAAKVGVKLPTETGKWTVAESIEAFKKLTISESGRVTVHGVQACHGGEGDVGVLRRYGGDRYNVEGTKALIGTPESIAGIQALQDLYQVHKVAVPLEAKANAQEIFPGQKVAITVLTAFAAGGAFPNTVGKPDGSGGGKFKWAVLPPPIGPSGKVETQVSSDGYGMAKSTKYPDEAWLVVKLYGSRQHGFERFKRALGSPGSRYDIWGSAEFKAEFPTLGGLIWDAVVDPAKNPPLKPWSHPENGRYNEADTAINNIMQAVWLGQKKPAEGAAEAQKAAQEILDKPPV